MDKATMEKLLARANALCTKIAALCEAEEPRGPHENHVVILNALINATASGGAVMHCSPEDLVKMFLEALQGQYSQYGWDVKAGMVPVRKGQDVAEAVKAHAKAAHDFDASDYDFGPLFDTGRPRTKREVH